MKAESPLIRTIEIKDRTGRVTDRGPRTRLACDGRLGQEDDCRHRQQKAVRRSARNRIRTLSTHVCYYPSITAYPGRVGV